MSNRRKPRAEVAELRFVDDARMAAATMDFSCPDCDATISAPTFYGSAVARIEVQHDDGCPWLSGVTR